MNYSISLPMQKLTLEEYKIERNGSGAVILTAGARSEVLEIDFEAGTWDEHILIGRYTSLGKNISIAINPQDGDDRAAAYSFTSWSPALGLDGHGRKGIRSQVIIGSDVRVESDVVIRGGLSIGNGAIVHAGAVLTEDIPPYAVVSGNPARVIRYRFEEETIQKLQQIKWWNWPETKVRENISLLTGNIGEFLKKHPSSDSVGIAMDDLTRSLQELRRQGYRVYYFVPDFSSSEAIWRRVFRTYLSTYHAADQTVLLMGIPDGNYDTYMAEIEIFLHTQGEDSPLILTYPTAAIDLPAVLYQTDVFITTKEYVSSLCVDYALDYGVEIRYGADWKEDVFPSGKTYDVSVCVLSYQPDYDKLYTTLTSIIRQKNCSFELVIGDDGTPNFRRHEIELWLLEHHFRDYTILPSPENKGTVHNMLQMLSVARGRYIKAISPGDYLYNDSVLGEMLRFMEREQYPVAFGRACYYHPEGDTCKILDTMSPLNLQLYEQKDRAAIKKACVIYGDFILGAALMGERRLITAYTNEVAEHIIYGEDTIYVRMAADDINIGFWDQNLIWYEVGIGISTNGGKEWKKRLGHDMDVCLLIIDELHEELRMEKEQLLHDNPGKSLRDMQMSYCRDAFVRYMKEKGSYLQNVDVRELELLTNTRVTFAS